MLKLSAAVILSLAVFGCSKSGDDTLYFPNSEKRSYNLINEDPEVDPFYIYEMYTNSSVQEIAEYYESVGTNIEDFEVNSEDAFGIFSKEGTEYQLEVSSSYEKGHKNYIMLSYYPE